MVKNACCLVIVAMFMLVNTAKAESPLKTVENHVGQLLLVLKDTTPGGGPAGEEKKKAGIRTIADSLFDFNELSRFALGSGWKRLSTEQQKEFVNLFRDLLEGIYIGRLLQYKDEKVIFKKETSLSESRYEVQTEIAAASGNIPLDYRLIAKDGQWKVYDLIIENTSLAKNYRAQFNSILEGKPPEKLLEMLREKVKAQKNQPT